MKNQCSVNIIFRKELLNKKKGTAPLALQAFINGKRVVVSLNLYIPPDAWDKAGQKVLGKEFTDIQLIIDRERAKANNIIVDARLSDLFLTSESFKEQFTDSANKYDFLGFYQKEMESRYNRDMISTGTYRNHKVTIEKLRAFKPQISFNDITSDFIESFDNWNKLRIRKYLKSKNMVPVKDSMGIRAKTFRNLRTYLNLGYKKLGIKITDPFSTTKIKEPKASDRIFLEVDELKSLDQLFDKNELNGYLQATLAKFMFACFTSLRVSDARNLEQIELDNNKIIFYPEKTKRTGKQVIIPLNQSALKYYQYIKAINIGSVSAEKLNLGLKKIAIKVQINKRITFHTARHTFGAQFIAAGGNVVVLQNIMGHADIHTTMIYVHLGKNLKQDQIYKMDSILN